MLAQQLKGAGDVHRNSSQRPSRLTSSSRLFCSSHALSDGCFSRAITTILRYLETTETV